MSTNLERDFYQQPYIDVLELACRAGQIRTVDVATIFFDTGPSGLRKAQKIVADLHLGDALVAHPDVKRERVYTPTRFAYEITGVRYPSSIADRSVMDSRVEHDSLALQFTARLARLLGATNFLCERELRSLAAGNAKIPDGKIILDQGLPYHEQDKDIVIEVEHQRKGGRKFQELIESVVDAAISPPGTHAVYVAYPWPPQDGLEHEKRLLAGIRDYILRLAEEDYGGLSLDPKLPLEKLRLCRMHLSKGRRAVIEDLEFMIPEWDRYQNLIAKSAKGSERFLAKTVISENAETIVAITDSATGRKTVLLNVNGDEWVEHTVKPGQEDEFGYLWSPFGYFGGPEVALIAMCQHLKLETRLPVA